MFRRPVILFLLSLLAAATATVDAAPEPGALSLLRGRTLGEASATLLNGGVRVVAADAAVGERSIASAAEPRLQERVEAATVEDALRALSTGFDMACLHRGPSVALQWRYGEPRFSPGLEIGEIRQAAHLAEALIRPFTPALQGEAYDDFQGAFVGSLTTEQQHAMLLPEGLPLAALSREQQRSWMLINSSHAYSEHCRLFRAWVLMMSLWPRVDYELLPDAIRQEGIPHLTYADPLSFNKGRGSLFMGWRPPDRRQRRSPQSEYWRLPVRGNAPPASLRQVWSIPCQRFELAALLRKLKESGGPTIGIPDYAAERPLWLASRGGTRAEVLTALCDLWGWELAPSEKGFRLGRPRSAPARDASDLHVKLALSVPPGLRHMARSLFRDRADEPWCRQMEEAAKDVEKVAGSGWRKIEVSRLSDTTQRRLANVAALRQLGAWYRNFDAWSRPPNWIRKPELGVLTLNEPLAPGKHPVLLFRVPDEPGHSRAWGWSVGTARKVQ